MNTSHRSLARSLAFALAAGAACPAFAQDRAEIDRTQIIGNRELPKVLYIVPWKKPIAGDLSGRPLKSVLDEALTPVDRDVFRREVTYGKQAETQPRGAAPATAAPAPALAAAPAPITK